MKTKYDELTLTHNILGVILPSDCYQQIYKKGTYLIHPIIVLYDETIDKDSTRTEVHRAEGNHEARRNDCQLYKTADNACQSFIMAVVNETWYKELEDPYTFYKKVTHGPQTTGPPNIILRWTSHRGRGGYSKTYEYALQGFRWSSLN